MTLLGTLLLLLTCHAHAATKVQVEFTEEVKSKNPGSYYHQRQKQRLKQDEAELEKVSLIQSARQIYDKYHNRVRVPGYISSSPVPQVARIIGPIALESSMRMGDTVYIRWSGAPLPRPGDRYSTFTPAVVLQNVLDPTDFQVFASSGPIEKMPKDYRMAGYFYEVTGQIKIIRIKGGVVEGLLEQLKSQVSVGDEIMLRPPLIENLTPINSGIQISAAVVCGNPHDRLSTTKRSFIYINRGARDGIRVGRVFESIETVKLDEGIGGAAPEVSNGEAIVIHVTDSYATAMITKQFEVIRIGSLLRSKQETNPINPISPFGGYQEAEAVTPDGKGIPEVPSLDNLPGGNDTSLPDPRRKRPEPSLSELDALEKSLSLKELTPTERTRLNKLSKQEKIGVLQSPEEPEEETGTPGAPAVENSFKSAKKPEKKPKKGKVKSKNDEEELNLLMMQN